MRLLTKSEITRQKSVERKTEIDEGVKLARRIDEMRETLAKEEANLAKYRSETAPMVMKETDVLIEKRTTLQKDIAELKKKRRELMQPLDAEWKKVKDGQKELERKESDLKDRVCLIENREEKLSQHEQQLAIEKGRIADEKKRSTATLVEVSELHAQAQADTVEADRRLAEATVYCENQYKILTSRETDLAARERENVLRQKSLTAREKEVNLREKFINDKYQTLLRAQTYVSRKRIKRPK